MKKQLSEQNRILRYFLPKENTKTQLTVRWKLIIFLTSSVRWNVSILVLGLFCEFNCLWDMLLTYWINLSGGVREEYGFLNTCSALCNIMRSDICKKTLTWTNISSATSSQQISGKTLRVNKTAMKSFSTICRSETTLNCRSRHSCIKITHTT